MNLASTLLRPTLLSISALALAAAAPAQSGGEPGLLLRLHGGFGPSTEFDGSTSPDAEVSVYRAGADLEYGMALDGGAALWFGFGAEAGALDFDQLGAANPALDAQFPQYGIQSLYLGYRRTLPDDTGLLLHLRAQTGTEGSADFADSLHYGVLAGVTTQVDDSLTVGLAVGGQSRLEGDPIPYLVPLVDWTIDETWSLSSGHVERDASGFGDLSGLRLKYRTSDAQDCYFGAGWQLRQVAFDPDDPVNPYAGGGLLENRFSVYGGTEWRAQHNLTLSLNLGYHLRQEYDVAPLSGPSPQDLKTDPAPFVALGVELRF